MYKLRFDVETINKAANGEMDTLTISCGLM